MSKVRNRTLPRIMSYTFLQFRIIRVVEEENPVDIKRGIVPGTSHLTSGRLVKLP